MASGKTTDPFPTPAGPATPPENGAQKGQELGDDELDKVAGGFGINIIHKWFLHTNNFCVAFVCLQSASAIFRGKSFAVAEVFWAIHFYCLSLKITLQI